MKKFFLYLIIFLLIAGLASVAYGFWSAKNIRKWAKTMTQIKLDHDISSQEKSIAEKMNASGGKKAEDFSAELAVFAADLDKAGEKIKEAKALTDASSVPPKGGLIKSELDYFYAKSDNQLQDMLGVSKYLIMVFKVTSIFDRMNPDATAEEVRVMIVEAKEKSKAVEVNVLPVEMRSSGNELKVAIENYLDQFDQFANGKVDSHDQLNASYGIFSGKINDFLLAKKNYFGTFEDLDVLGEKIDEHLMVLGEVKFSIR
jgi:hypothetical protein